MTPASFLLIDDSTHNQDMYYATRFLASDRFLYLKSQDKEILLISQMELGRARMESEISDIRTTTDYDIIGKLKRYGRAAAYNLVVSELLHDEGVTRVSVPHNFPVSIADALRSHGVEVIPVPSPIAKLRSVKSSGEIDQIKKAQACCENAMQTAIDAIRRAKVVDGVLFDFNSNSNSDQPLTSERVRAAIEHTLIDCGCESESTIVAGGMDASNPHNVGTGVLRVDESIVIDIFPRLSQERYYADMTRTVARGSPSQELIEMYDAVLDAQSVGLRTVRAGVSGGDVHDAVCDCFRDYGYVDMFTHSTGHGVGLNVHENPSIGTGGEVLEAGNVITIEPGLYGKIGGIRLEDLVVVTKTGCINLTTITKRFLV
ncbi:MAG: Xaa-Pro peptidase family protein [Euryarchaeota archaeon]|nr:Xaa-Pro peptidase family protein [Euryarchaeota archaeon]